MNIELEKFSSRYTETIESLEREVKVQMKQLQEVVEENKILKTVIEAEKVQRRELHEQVNKIETFSRKDNLIFIGFAEEKNENCEAKITQCLSAIGLGELHPRAIVRAHRVGRFNRASRKPRAIITKFAHYKDREITWRNAGKVFRQCGIKIEEDFPEDIRKRRKTLLPVYWAIYHHKDESHPHTWPYRRQLRLQADRLYFNGMVITVDTLHKLPEKFHPSRLCSPTNNNITAFFTKSSPLSNHYGCQFEINRRQYNCVEQYLMMRKASFCGDHHLADKIMQEADPVRQKSLGKLAEASTNFSRDEWKKEALHVVKIAVSAKFRQVDICKNFLVQTDNNVLIEANPTDHFWGVGLHLRDNNLWDPKQWKGINNLGKILMEVRTELRR